MRSMSSGESIITEQEEADFRSEYELLKAELKRKRKILAAADLETVQRRIDELKSSGRVDKKEDSA